MTLTVTRDQAQALLPSRYSAVGIESEAVECRQTVTLDIYGGVQLVRVHNTGATPDRWELRIARELAKIVSTITEVTA
jgi:hypothetical protein